MATFILSALDSTADAAELTIKAARQAVRIISVIAYAYILVFAVILKVSQVVYALGVVAGEYYYAHQVQITEAVEAAVWFVEEPVIDTMVFAALAHAFVMTVVRTIKAVDYAAVLESRLPVVMVNAIATV